MDVAAAKTGLKSGSLTYPSELLGAIFGTGRPKMAVLFRKSISTTIAGDIAVPACTGAAGTSKLAMCQECAGWPYRPSRFSLMRLTAMWSRPRPVMSSAKRSLLPEKLSGSKPTQLLVARYGKSSIQGVQFAYLNFRTVQVFRIILQRRVGFAHYFFAAFRWKIGDADRRSVWRGFPMRAKTTSKSARSAVEIDSLVVCSFRWADSTSRRGNFRGGR